VQKVYGIRVYRCESDAASACLSTFELAKILAEKGMSMIDAVCFTEDTFLDADNDDDFGVVVLITNDQENFDIIQDHLSTAISNHTSGDGETRTDLDGLEVYLISLEKRLNTPGTLSVPEILEGVV